MEAWTILILALAPFFAIGFLLTWAIREGGSFSFLHPGRWRKPPRPRTEVDEGRHAPHP